MSNSPIRSFEGEYRYLSNFWLCPVEWAGIKWPSSENAYQASKSLDIEKHMLISKMGPSDAKREGKLMKERGEIRPDFHKIKIVMMTNIVTAKFKQNPLLMQILVETGDALLEEGNWWKDTFWGICPVGSGEGYNHLGKILMDIRFTEQLYIHNMVN